MSTYKLKTELVFTKEDIDEIVCTAFERGITYWCNDIEVVNDDRTDIDECFLSDLITRGKTLILHDAEEDKLYELDLNIVLRGLALYVQNEGYKTYGDGRIALDGLDDTAVDMIIQYGIFGEVVYG